MAEKTVSRRVSLKETLEGGQMTYAEICEAIISGKMSVLSVSRPVKVCSCKGQYQGWTFDRWGKWNPDEAEKTEFEENIRWRRYLLRVWGRDVELGRGTAQELCASLKIASIEGADFFPFPMDARSIANMGLDDSTHRSMLLSFTQNAESLDYFLSDREDATNLKIIEGLMRELKIDPTSRKAASQVKMRLEMQGIELDDETIRKRIFRLREKTGKT